MKKYLFALVLCLGTLSMSAQEAVDNNPAMYDLADSSQLTHVYGLFFRNENNHLYMKMSTYMVYSRDSSGIVRYFNGDIDQSIDPYTFHPLNGWYAVDGNNVYYYKTRRNGILIEKMPYADASSFKLLPGKKSYGQDKNNFYENRDAIAKFPVSESNIVLDSDGRAIRLEHKRRKYLLNKYD